MEVNGYWHGSDDELRRLIGAVQRHCTCLPGSETCGPHAMLHDEHVLNHLVFAIRMRDRLQREEWSESAFCCVPYAILTCEAENA